MELLDGLEEIDFDISSPSQIDPLNTSQQKPVTKGQPSGFNRPPIAPPVPPPNSNQGNGMNGGTPPKPPVPPNNMQRPPMPNAPIGGQNGMHGGVPPSMSTGTPNGMPYTNAPQSNYNEQPQKTFTPLNKDIQISREVAIHKASGIFFESLEMLPIVLGTVDIVLFTKYAMCLTIIIHLVVLFSIYVLKATSMLPQYVTWTLLGVNTVWYIIANNRYNNSDYYEDTAETDTQDVDMVLPDTLPDSKPEIKPTAETKSIVPRPAPPITKSVAPPLVATPPVAPPRVPPVVPPPTQKLDSVDDENEWEVIQKPLGKASMKEPSFPNQNFGEDISFDSFSTFGDFDTEESDEDSQNEIEESQNTIENINNLPDDLFSTVAPVIPHNPMESKFGGLGGHSDNNPINLDGFIPKPIDTSNSKQVPLGEILKSPDLEESSRSLEQMSDEINSLLDLLDAI